MGLKTNTKLYSDKIKRVMTINEMAATLVLPTTPAFALLSAMLQTHQLTFDLNTGLHAEAKAAKAPQIHLDEMKASCGMHLLGNGMNVAVAGALIIVTMIHAQKV